MTNDFISKFVDNLILNNIANHEDRENIIYGLKIGIQSLINTITTLILGICFNLVLESLIFLILYSIIRTYTGGYHCKNEITCYFFSSAIIIIVLLFQKYNLMSVNFTYYIMIIGSILILSIAPIGDYNKPLEEIEKKVYGKKVRLILLTNIIIFLICVFFMIEVVYENIALAIIMVSVTLVFGKIKNNIYKL